MSTAGPSSLTVRFWPADIVRALGIILCATALGLLTNFFGHYPIPILAANGPGALPEKAQRIGVEALRTELEHPEHVLVLDVRTQREFDSGHPAMALHTPAGAFAEHYQRYNLGVRIREAHLTVILCASEKCSLSDRVAKVLRELGHENVRVLYDGWQSYKASGLPQEGTATP